MRQDEEGMRSDEMDEDWMGLDEMDEMDEHSVSSTAGTWQS